MNAKKIMGAVLVALLAAALLVGAGAAGDLKSGTVFVNQALGEEYNVEWIGVNGPFTPLADPKYDKVFYFPAGSEGVYTYEKEDKTKITITVKAPEAVISGVAGSGATAYTFIPGTYYGEDGAKILITSPMLGYYVFVAAPGAAPVMVAEVDDGSDSYSPEILAKIDAAGEYAINLQYKIDNFVNGTKVDAISTKPVTFTVANAGDATITASANQVLKAEPITLTIIGQPGVEYTLEFDDAAFEIADDQESLVQVETDDTKVDDGVFKFVMPNTGKIDIVVKADEAGKSETITLKALKADNSAVLNADKRYGTVTIKFTAGAITDVKTDAPSYFIGADAEITGITSAGPIDKIVITGSNFKATIEDGDEVKALTALDIEYGTGVQQTFEFDLPTGDLKNQDANVGILGKMIDVGPYVVTLYAGDAEASVGLLLTQPFLSIVSAPEFVVQDEDAEFIINAEATDDFIRAYFFGNNFFYSLKGVSADDDVDTHYSVTIDAKITANMTEGQYFAVFQHPMYDGKYNVSVSEDMKWITVNGAEKIDLLKRQSSNAAEALCVELDAQGIDDIYVKHSFVIVDKDESSFINPIPETVAQGSTFTVSGVDTANAGASVTVQMLSTAFNAIPKEAQNVASFAVIQNAVIGEDGKWEVTLDTTGLNLDDYNVEVFIDGESKKKAEVTVVEAADEPVTPPTDEPGQDEPGQDEPVAPETPGFGALAALAGLGAVAVLLLRRE